MVYALRLMRAAVIGAVLSILWMFFVFGSEPPALGPYFSRLAWIGVARILIALAIVTFLAALGVVVENWVDFHHPRWRRLARPFQAFARWIQEIRSSNATPFWARMTIDIVVLIAIVTLAFGFVLPAILMPVIAVFKPTAFTIYVWWQVESARVDGLSGSDFASALISGEISKELLGIYAKGVVGGCFFFSAPIVLVEWRERLLEHPLFRRLFVHGKGGSSRWAGPRSYGLRSAVSGRNLPMGRTNLWDAGLDYGKDIGLGDDAHTLTVACQGSGKSVTGIWPTLGQYEGGIIVLDPKAEHAQKTYWYRTAAKNAKGLYTRHHLPGNPQGYKLDPHSQDFTIPSAHYNLVSEIDVYDDRVLEKLAAISDGCVLPEGDKNQHWVEGSRTILEGVIAHVLSRELPENRNLPYVHDLLLGFDPELGISDPKRLANFLGELRANPIAGGICFKAANLIAQDTRGAMMTTVLRSIKWIGDPAMRKHLTQPSDFKFADVPNRNGGAGNTVYIVAPIGPLMKEQVRWLRSLTNLSITIIRNGEKPRDRTLFILDEFPQLQGKLTAVEEGIVTLRSSHVRLSIYIQQIGQLKKDYAMNWNTFNSSSHVQAFGIADPETAEWLSLKMLGSAMRTQTADGSGHSGPARPIMTAQEIMNEFGKNQPRQIVFPNDGGFPMRLERLAYKSLVIDGKAFRAYPGLHGRFEEPENS